MEKTKRRNGFASGIGFILAAAGSAVGLGNLWSFPYKTSANGGAAFVIVYILSVIVIGSIVMLAEIYLGKRAQANPVTAYKKANKGLGWLGLFAIVIPLLITCYYSILGGYTVKFTLNSCNFCIGFAKFCFCLILFKFSEIKNLLHLKLKLFHKSAFKIRLEIQHILLPEFQYR